MVSLRSRFSSPIRERIAEAIRAELEKKYGQHTELVGTLQEKQRELAEVGSADATHLSLLLQRDCSLKAESELVVLRRKVDSLEKELKEMPFLKEVSPFSSIKRSVYDFSFPCL